MRPCNASSCCCQARNLPWAPCTDSSCCCQARNLPWAPVPVPASSCCCQVQSVSWVPVRPPIAAVSIATPLPCATFRSPHTAGGFHFLS
ncbi:unnamed protein product [Staurois parvus]|uniref:Uncharacterized protein n=1 Tax=Staurois parvus TaxID=386267 RepID=A0ABN9HUS6_9NEOB|nr:unnamed protein product [Staurois parvus]